MTSAATKHNAARDIDALVERLRDARQWGWDVFDHRIPGVARDLAWALIAMTRDHDPDTYKRCKQAAILDHAQIADALDLAAGIAGLIDKADRLQPHLIRGGEVKP